MKRLRVYLSSTFEDLKEYRAAVFAALEKAGLDVARMEAYTAADERPLDLCLRDVAKSDIYVGLFAWRYGYEPPAEHGNPLGRSITELEYSQAETLKLRKLLFAAHPDTKAAWPDRFKDEVTGQGGRGEKLNRFRNALGTEKTTSFFRTPEELATLVLASIMRSGMSGRTYNVPPLPAGFVPRPSLTGAIVSALVGGANGAQGTSTLLHGAGGFGKTTLAIDVCHQPEVVNAFPDGLLWTTLGEHAELRRVLADLHILASGSPPVVAGLDEIGRALAFVLQGRRCLLVLDDLWSSDHLEPFLKIQGPQLLVTSRIRSLVEEAEQTGWPEVPVDETEASEAAQILGRGLVLDDRARATLWRLADRLGRWALLLRLVNARLLEENKTRPEKLYESIARVTTLFERKGVFGFDLRDSKARNAAVGKSVDVGLERADEMYCGLAQKAAEISIFPEDLAIPTCVLAELWSRDEFDVQEEVVRPLHNLSLFKWDREADVIEVHDMIRRALHERLTDPAAMHRKLINAWGDPYRLAHYYAWRWFGWHCIRAQEVTTLRRLVLDFDWLQKKLNATEINALIGEFAYLNGELQATVIQSALRASAHVLAKQPAELATQLVGRVADVERLDLQEFFARLRAVAPRPWLRPLRASLAAPALLRVIRVGSRVRVAAVTNEGTRIVSVDENNKHTVWHVDKAAPLRTVEWNYGRTASVLIGATRPFEVTSTFAEGSVRWDLESGECLERDAIARQSRSPLPAKENESERVVWCSQELDGSMWIAITERNRSWEGGGQREYSAYRYDGGGAARIAFRFSDFHFSTAAIASNGLRLITSSFPTGTVIWDLKSGTPLGAIAGDQVQAIACDSNGEFVVTASYSGIISLWNLNSLVSGRRDAAGHTRSVVDTQVSKNATVGFSVSVDGTACTWDLNTGAVITSIAPEADTATDVDWSVSAARIDVDNGQVDFLIHDADFLGGVGYLHSYDLATGAHVPSPVPPIGGIAGLPNMGALFGRSPVELGSAVDSPLMKPLCISPDSTRGATVSQDQTLWIWELSTGTKIASFGLDSTVTCCACTARAQTLIVGDASGRVHILRLEEKPE